MEIIGKCIGSVGGAGVGGIEWESSKVELEENKVPKRLALSGGELAIELLGRKRGGKEGVQKLLQMFLVKDQKDLLEEELVRTAVFLTFLLNTNT